jgi:hypothetical protein
MSVWVMQVLVAENGDRVWKSVHPSGKNAKPYQYATEYEAKRMLRICYPDQCLLGGDGTVRVLEINKEEESP